MKGLNLKKLSRKPILEEDRIGKLTEQVEGLQAIVQQLSAEVARLSWAVQLQAYTTTKSEPYLLRPYPESWSEWNSYSSSMVLVMSQWSDSGTTTSYSLLPGFSGTQI